MGKRRRTREKLSPSLFPFISVLITIIGVLIFMTIAFSLSAIELPLFIESAVETSSGAVEHRMPIVLECKDNKAFVIKNIAGKVVQDTEFNIDETWNHVVQIYRKGKENSADSWKDEPFLDFLDSLKGRAPRFLLFLVRPSGVYSYTLLNDIVKMRNEIKPEDEETVMDEWQAGWRVDWAIIYQEENRRVLPPA